MSAGLIRFRRIAVYCGSAQAAVARHRVAAEALARHLATTGIGIVFGGGHVGLMGVVADAALAAGGEVIGVIPSFMVEAELAHQNLSRLEIVADMHQRKLRMAELSDACIALPGGYGTLDELFEWLTWSQIGLHAKPAGVLDGDGFFAPLLAFLDQATSHGFVRPGHRDLLVSAAEPATLLARLAGVAVPEPAVPGLR